MTTTSTSGINLPSSNPETETQVLVDTAVRTVPPAELEPGKIYAFNTPKGVTQVDLTGDAYRDAPRRKTGVTLVRDAASFLTYYAKHSNEASEVYANVDLMTITAVLDAHEGAAARWESHRLRLELSETQAWTEWLGKDGRLMGQEEFAEFVEDHLPDLLEPSGAEMLEIAQSIQGAAKADFQSGTRLSSGERRFKYIETIKATAGQSGELTIPEKFVVGLVPCEGSEGYKLTARLRYRIEGGHLRIGYKLERPLDVARTAFNDVRKAVEDSIATPIMNGAPA